MAQSRRSCNGKRLRSSALLACAGLAAWSQAPRLPCYTVPGEFDKYSLQEVLGTGAYGSVYEGTDNSGMSRAVKVIPMWRMQLDNKREEYRAKLESEIDVHKHIGPHPNIVGLVDSIDIEGDVAGWPRWKMIVLELARGGELKDLIQAEGKIGEEKAKHIFKQVVAAVQHLHNRRVIHRDLKTDNILLCTGTATDTNKPAIKLIDFGAGHWAKDGQPFEATGCVGTMETMAPEVILSRGDDFDGTDSDNFESTHRVEYRTRPFGIRKYQPGPGGIGARIIEMVREERYKGDPLGQAWKKDVQPGWVVKAVGGIDVTTMKFDDILDLMGDRLLDNSSRGAFDGSYKVTGDNKGKGKILPRVAKLDMPLAIDYAQLKGKPYGSKVDVWSLGVILYNMVEGKAPFDVNEEDIVAGKFDPPTGSPMLKDLISKMIVTDPQARLSLEQVAAHPWLA